MSEPTQRRGEQTRQAIIQAAHDLFVQQGYHGTSMRQIAGNAKIALGGLYNHFASKEEVFEAVFLEYHPYREVIPAILAAPGETIEQFANDTIRRMLSAIHGQPEFLNLMFIEVVEFKNIHTQQLFINLMPQLNQILANVIDLNGDRLRPIPARDALAGLFRTVLWLFLDGNYPGGSGSGGIPGGGGGLFCRYLLTRGFA